jgi:D-arabinose 1-dehydrogenase-like Zn-dependent alcohol dehydrogenase
MNVKSSPVSSEAPTASVGPSMMRAIVQREYGTADTLSLAVIGRPSIGDNEVLIRVRAAGLDRGTWHLMAGLPYAVRPIAGLRGPKQPVPGLDVAGVVTAVGSAVTRFRPGDEVFGIAKGSFAEFAPAREDKLALKPSTLTFEQAAAMPISGLTALRGLETVAKVIPGQHVLIIGASGGVGTHAVQIAKALGATVTGVCSTPKVELVPTMSSTTPARILPTAPSATTSSSTSVATRRSLVCARHSPPLAHSSSRAARAQENGLVSDGNSTRKPSRPLCANDSRRF